MSVEFEYWWLLVLPLFFTLGWIAARVDIRQLISESTTLPAAYFKGLNFLISDQHHKAVEAFTEAININNDSLELHFALGSLFRRTGETDRAIHLHLSLLEKKELTEPQKNAVKAELAQDYLKAGLFDRAEELFKGLDDTRYRQPALRSLLEIYVREREWSQAIAMATELERLSGVPFRKEIAQYHCELAMNAIIAQDYDKAKQLLAEALEANKDCVRANVLLGDIEANTGAHAAAISYWKRIEFQQPEFLGLVANKMLKSYAASKKGSAGLKEGIAQLNNYLETYQLPTLISVLYEATLAEEGAEAAAKLARNELIRKPNLKALDQLLQARAMVNDHQQDIQLMQQTVRNAIGDRAAYHCNQCGFRAKQYHWQCPACNAWESLPSEPSEATIRDIKLINRK
ncbi:putative N-acetylglucosaminyl transferase [Methylophilaceae bacterium 11]|jgi:lipopolysaccharide biosynthesis regulator YciM|uniref:lipopolysaccharide assembly protein LapB n=1 Tax=unclassified Methylotenera TaxID=2643294 RepID=UPI00037727FC|nr:MULTISPECIES: lipopolysaccharide assembly protein LapB [unclassified Methylotenera]EUJ10142.1 putative N-acetylglucosaminyl transferase [Methylophilaceae bacterium 11]